MTVVDASLLIDVLVGLPAGRPWRRWAAQSEMLAAPDCAGVELGRYLRRHVLRGALPTKDAESALRAFHVLGMELYPTEPLLDPAYAMRENVSFDDALYLALASALDEPLATTDGGLARAGGTLGFEVMTAP